MSRTFKKDGQDVVLTAGIASRNYEAKTLTVANAAEDYNTKVTGGLFAKIETALYCEIRTNQPISVKINATTNAAIDILAADSPYIIDWAQVENLFISNASGNPATVKIVIAG
jgi:hypothetical protein